MKLAGEIVTKGLCNFYKIPYTIIRPSAVYGPTVINRRVSQIFIENALDGMTISSNGEIVWTPDVVGEYGPITVTVYDGGEDGSVPFVQSFMVNVVYLYTVADYAFSSSNNLMSFYSIPPESQSIESVFGQLGSNASTIFRENQVAFQLPNGSWVGSLQNIEADDGYWFRLDESTNFTLFGLPTGVVEYSVHSGNNLLSSTAFSEIFAAPLLTTLPIVFSTCSNRS